MALEGEEYLPARQQDFNMAGWVKDCIWDMAMEIGGCAAWVVACRELAGKLLLRACMKSDEALVQMT